MEDQDKVAATIYTTDGEPFIEFYGSPQQVAAAAAIYVLEVANPLIPAPPFEEDQQAAEE